jgi:MFS family permease
MTRSTNAETRRPALQPGVGKPAVMILMATAFAMSMAYGMLLLLPLYVNELGGDEAHTGLILSSAAVAALLSLVALVCFPDAMRPHSVLALSIGLFGIGSAVAALVTGGWEPLILVGALLGTAWAVFYTVAPMTISAMVTDSGRTTHFGFLTGSEQLGVGAGPVLAGILIENGVGFRGTFTIAAVLCAVAVVGAVSVGVITPDGRARATGQVGEADLGMREALRAILRSQAAVWLGLIVLFACLFTAMTQFQTTFAAARGLDYSIFYVSYTVAVIFVRFLVAPWAARFDPSVVIAVSISLMTLAVASFLAVGSDAVAYTAASAVLGMGYGLALPGVQAQVVNASAAAVRPKVLPIAGLVFQAAILTFPLAVGWMVVSFGYWMLFTVLSGFALLQASISWWHVLRTHRPSRRRPTRRPPRAELAWSAGKRGGTSSTTVRVSG